MNRTLAALSLAPVAGAARPCGYGYTGWQAAQATASTATTLASAKTPTKPMAAVVMTASKRHLTVDFGNAIDAGPRLPRKLTT